jgi:hypothetical protein
MAFYCVPGPPVGSREVGAGPKELISGLVEGQMCHGGTASWSEETTQALNIQESTAKTRAKERV